MALDAEEIKEGKEGDKEEGAEDKGAEGDEEAGGPAEASEDAMEVSGGGAGHKEEADAAALRTEFSNLLLKELKDICTERGTC